MSSYNTFKNEYCVVKDAINGDIIISDYFEQASVATNEIMTKSSTLNEVVASDVPDLPSVGEMVEKDKLYNYNGEVIQCVQTHTRTIYAPQDTPALFSFYRTNTTGLAWIINEKVDVGWERTFNGKVYVVLQAHMTQDAWNPEKTLGILWSQKVTSNEWAVGVAYKVGDIVTYLGKTYKCLQAHTSQAGWTPSAVPALWNLQ